MLTLLLAFALTTVNLDVYSVPLTAEARFSLSPAARCDLKREGNLTRIRLDIDKLNPSASFGPVFNTYVVWTVSPEGLIENVGELDVRGVRGQLSATTRLTQFGVIITAEPHYMVDRPSSAVAYRSQVPESDIRRRSVAIQAGAFDYSTLKPISAVGVHSSVAQARTAFQIAQAAGAEKLAVQEYRNAQVLMNSLQELVSRGAAIDVVWPAANEAIRISQRAATLARGTR